MLALEESYASHDKSMTSPECPPQGLQQLYTDFDDWIVKFEETVTRYHKKNARTSSILQMEIIKDESEIESPATRDYYLTLQQLYVKGIIVPSKRTSRENVFSNTSNSRKNSLSTKSTNPDDIIERFRICLNHEHNFDFVLNNIIDGKINIMEYIRSKL